MGELWVTEVNPLGNQALSGLLASLPVILLFLAIIWMRMSLLKGLILANIIALLLALLLFKMPLEKAIFSMLFGFLFGLFPISYIVLGAIYFFNLLQLSGNFSKIRDSIMRVSDDLRVQVVLVAFCFGSFLESASGFGTPVAVTVALLRGFGFDFKTASVLALLANTSSVAFGALGIPVIVGAQVSDVDLKDLTRAVGIQIAPLSFLIPFYLVYLVSGLRGISEIFSFLFIVGLSYALAKGLVSYFVGPYLPGLVASLTATGSALLYLRFKNNRGGSTIISKDSIKPWGSVFLLCFLLLLWGMQSMRNLLDTLFSLEIPIPELHREILDPEGNLREAIFKFNLLSSAGTALLVSAIISAPLQGLKIDSAVKSLFETGKNLWRPVLIICLVLSFAFILNYSGLALAMGYLIAYAGPIFPILSAFLGWLGVFITGSDTSSNALFGKLQASAGSLCGIEPTLAVATNTVGGVMGKMISPQSLAIACASAGATGKENEILTVTIKHSLLLTLLVGLFALFLSRVLNFPLSH